MIPFSYWGKSPRDTSEHHPLPCHCLDVAAVCRALLECDARLERRLAGLLPGAHPLRLLPYLAALHDVGKFSPRFQWFKPELAARLQPGRRGLDDGKLARDTKHHSHLGQWLWRHHLKPVVVDALSFADPHEAGYVLDVLMPSVFGHHGRPSEMSGDGHFEDEDIAAALAFADALRPLFLVDAESLALDSDAEEQAERASWDLAGLTVLCDWIGSNSRWFPLCPDADDMARYYLGSVSKKV